MKVEVTLRNSQGNTKVVKNVGMEILGAAFKELPDEVKKTTALELWIASDRCHQRKDG